MQCVAVWEQDVTHRECAEPGFCPRPDRDFCHPARPGPSGPGQNGRLRCEIVTDIHDLTVTELAAAIGRKELSPVQITDHYLDRIERLDADVGAFVTVTAELARQQAAEAEKAVAQAPDPRDLPPLHGVPTAIKDLNMVAGVPPELRLARCIADFVPDVDDHVVTLLRAAGTISSARRPPRSSGCPATPRPTIGAAGPHAVGPDAGSPGGSSGGAGGRGGGRPGPVRAGQRRRRLDPDPGQRVRPGRDQAVPRTGLRGPLDLDVDRAVGARPAGPHGARRRRAARRDRRAAAGRPDCAAAAAGRRDLPRLVRPRPGPAADRPLPHRRSRRGVDPQCAAAWEERQRAAGRASGTRSRTSTRRSPPDAVPAFETVWAVSAATPGPAASRGRAAPADPAPARAGPRPSAAPSLRRHGRAAACSRRQRLVATAATTRC